MKVWMSLGRLEGEAEKDREERQLIRRRRHRSRLWGQRLWIGGCLRRLLGLEGFLWMRVWRRWRKRTSADPLECPKMTW